MKQTDTRDEIYAPDFELPGTDDRVHHLSSYLESFQAVGVIFMADNCPYVRSYIERLKQIQTDFGKQGFTLIGINAHPPENSLDESLEMMKNFAAEHELNFPYLRDTTQDVAKCFKTNVTPEAFLIDKSGSVCYRGKIDDYAESADAVKTSYLRDSISALLAGEKIEPEFTQAVGSLLVWRK